MICIAPYSRKCRGADGGVRAIGQRGVDENLFSAVARQKIMTRRCDAFVVSSFSPSAVEKSCNLEFIWKFIRTFVVVILIRPASAKP